MRTALWHLAVLLNRAEVGHPEQEAFMQAHGWEFVGSGWRSPEELEELPTCRHCGEKYDPSDWRCGQCLSDDAESPSGVPEHAPKGTA